MDAGVKPLAGPVCMNVEEVTQVPNVCLYAQRIIFSLLFPYYVSLYLIYWNSLIPRWAVFRTELSSHCVIFYYL